MKPGEDIAYQYLVSRGLGQIDYEPNKGHPPDFAINNEIGVEVRRLNQNYFSDSPNDSNVEGLEEKAIPLNMTMERVLRKYDNRYSGKSYWVYIHYQRPLPPTSKKLAQLLDQALETFLANPSISSTTVSLNQQQSLFFDIVPCTPTEGRVFRFAGSSDGDSGGWLVEVFTQSVRHCIEEKSLKILPYMNNYTEWWLLLVDKIGWALMSHEADEIKLATNSLGQFSRVVIVDSTGSRCCQEWFRNTP